ncbi:unnamed protein product [Bathycoccus prasinos]
MSNSAKESIRHRLGKGKKMTNEIPTKVEDDDDDKKEEQEQSNPIEHAIASVVEYVGFFPPKFNDVNEENAGKLETKLSESGLETMVYIRSRLDVKYDETQREHVDMLKILWRSCFDEDGVEFPLPSKSSSSSSASERQQQPRLGHASEKWKDMGWQGTHPSTDLRGCGVFALENLVYFSQTRKDLFKVLVEKKNGKRSDWEYPFAAAGVNVTHELTKLLDVDGIIETDRVDKCVVGFLELVRRRRTTSSSNNNNDNDSSINGGSSFRRKEAFVAAFHELYCDAFEILDREWLLAEATYMEFPKVLERTIRVKTREKLERFAEEAAGPT